MSIMTEVGKNMSTRSIYSIGMTIKLSNYINVRLNLLVYMNIQLLFILWEII